MTKPKMQRHDLKQGTPEWLSFRTTTFNASDAPAMLGVSPYKTRNELLHEMHTGMVAEVDAATQRRFDDGHRFEALARPIAEEIIGDDLYPIVGSQDFGLSRRLAASFDGLTMGSDICFEHKSLNDELRAIFLHGMRIATDLLDSAELPEYHRVQMEQQLMVSDATNCIFIASKFDGNDQLLEKEHCFYEVDPVMRERIFNGWQQFERDLAHYTPTEITEKPKAEVTIELPALFVHAKGEITEHNMEAFGIALTTKLVEVRAIALVTDQDFSNAKEAAKKFRETAKAIALSKEAMLAQTDTIGEAARKMDAWVKDLNGTALQLEKDVEREDLAKKRVMISDTATAYSAHIEALEAETRPIQLNVPRPNFAEAIKNKRNYTSMQGALDDALANGKIAADAIAKDIRGKQGWLCMNASGHEFLISDLQQIITKPIDDFKLLVTTRIETHKKAEADKIERIRAEEQVKAEAAAKAKIEAEARAKTEQEAETLAASQREHEKSLAGEKTVLQPEPSPSAPSRRPAVTWPFPMPAVVHDKSSAHADTQEAIARKDASHRPTRMQIIEAVAEHFGMSVLAADELLRTEFEQVAA